MDLSLIFGPMFKVPLPQAPTGASTAADPLNKVRLSPDPVQSKKNLYIGIAVALCVLILMLGGGAYFMSSTSKNGVSA